MTKYNMAAKMTVTPINTALGIQIVFEISTFNAKDADIEITAEKRIFLILVFDSTIRIFWCFILKP